MKEKQEKQLKFLVNYVYYNVPYYTKLFDSLNIKPEHIRKFEDLEKLPILTKEIIKSNYKDFIPKNLNKLKYRISSTSGSTGEPFKYRLSIDDYERGIALLYRGWGYAGYKIGDKVAIIGGSSLIPDIKFDLIRSIQEFLLNFRFYSSFGMSEESLWKYVKSMNSWKPVFIRGYASSIYLLSKFIEENNIKLSFTPKAIFTTAEKLTPKMRSTIEMVFKVKVFDNYGLNDGGVSAYECEAHRGLHVDMERAILEVVDDNGKQIYDKEGKILATSLYNFALPFIRYDTGDSGVVSIEKCFCGREGLILKSILGRMQEFVTNSYGEKIHGEFFSHIFWGIENVKQFQVIQKKKGEVIINIIPDNWSILERIAVDKIVYIIKNKGFQNVSINFIEEKDLIYTKSGKYKFVINEVDGNK